MAFYSSLAPFGYLGFATLAVIPTRDPHRRALRLQAIMRNAFRFMHDWLRLVRVMDTNPRQLRGKIPETPCIVIANHPTLSDVTLIMSAIPRVCTLIKPRFYDKVWLRPLLAGAGQFRSGTETLLGTQETLDTAVERLRDGFHVLVFPEGSRSPPGELRPFGRGAFAMACRANVPIVPVVIHADPLWLTRGDWVCFPPAELPRQTLEVLPTLYPVDFAGDSRAMRDHVEAMYRRRLVSTPMTLHSHETDHADGSDRVAVSS